MEAAGTDAEKYVSGPGQLTVEKDPRIHVPAPPFDRGPNFRSE
jgi:hypothetical protein